MGDNPAYGVVKLSARGYEQTISSLVEAIGGRELTLFARVDHAGAAHEAGLELSDEQVLHDPRELAGAYEFAGHEPALEGMARLLDELTSEAAS